MWLTLVDIECEGPYCDPHHALTVVEELDGLCVQGKVPQVLYASGGGGGGGGGIMLTSKWYLHGYNRYMYIPRTKWELTQ